MAPRRLAATAILVWSPVAFVATVLTVTILWAFVGLPVLALATVPLRLAARVAAGRPAPAWWGVAAVVLAVWLTMLAVGAAVIQPEQRGVRVGLGAAAAGWGSVIIWCTWRLAVIAGNRPRQNGRSTLD